MAESETQLFRVKAEYKRNPSAIYDPRSGAHIVPDPSAQYTADDPIVKANGWYFAPEGEEEAPPPVSVSIAEVEAATRAPGEKRNGPIRTRRAPKKAE